MDADHSDNRILIPRRFTGFTSDSVSGSGRSWWPLSLESRKVIEGIKFTDGIEASPDPPLPDQTPSPTSTHISSGVHHEGVCGTALTIIKGGVTDLRQSDAVADDRLAKLFITIRDDVGGIKSAD